MFARGWLSFDRRLMAGLNIIQVLDAKPIVLTDRTDRAKQGLHQGVVE
jgi:hypothetical protein